MIRNIFSISTKQLWTHRHINVKCEFGWANRFAPIFIICACFSLVCMIAPPLAAQTLSPNSGINASDTWAVFDMTVQAQSSQNISGQTVSANQTETWHVEAGYDANDKQVLNITPTGAWAQQIPIGAIRVADGQLYIFDASGNLLDADTANFPLLNPFQLGGPASSVVSMLVVPNIQAYAAGRDAQLATHSNIATVSMTSSASRAPGNVTYTYQQSGNYWLATGIVIAPSISNGNIQRNITISNLGWNDNAANDQTRANNQTSGSYGPAPTTATPGPLTTTSPAQSCWTPSLNTPEVFNNGGSLNLLMQHGLWSDSTTWCYIEPNLAADFQLGTVILPPWTPPRLPHFPPVRTRKQLRMT